MPDKCLRCLARSVEVSWSLSAAGVGKPRPHGSRFDFRVQPVTNMALILMSYPLGGASESLRPRVPRV